MSQSESAIPRDPYHCSVRAPQPQQEGSSGANKMTLGQKAVIMLVLLALATTFMPQTQGFYNHELLGSFTTKDVVYGVSSIVFLILAILSRKKPSALQAKSNQLPPKAVEVRNNKPPHNKYEEYEKCPDAQQEIAAVLGNTRPIAPESPPLFIGPQMSILHSSKMWPKIEEERWKEESQRLQAEQSEARAYRRERRNITAASDTKAMILADPRKASPDGWIGDEGDDPLTYV